MRIGRPTATAIVRRSQRFDADFETISAKKTISASFRNSDGWAMIGPKLHPVRVTALRPAERTEHQRLEAKRTHEHHRRYEDEPPLRHQLNDHRDQQRDNDNQQRTGIRRVGVLPLRDRRDRLRGKPP